MEFRQPLKDKIGYEIMWKSKVSKYLRKSVPKVAHFYTDISKQVLYTYIIFLFKIGLGLEAVNLWGYVKSFFSDFILTLLFLTENETPTSWFGQKNSTCLDILFRC